MSDHISKVRPIVLSLGKKQPRKQNPLQSTSTKNRCLKNQPPEFIFNHLTVSLPKLQATSHSDLKSALFMKNRIFLKARATGMLGHKSHVSVKFTSLRLISGRW